MQTDPRIVETVQQLVERGSAFDVETLEAIYADDQYLLFIDDRGRVERVSRESNLASFREWRDEGRAPLSTEAEILHIEQQHDNAVVLLRRRMHPDAASRLFELRLRATAHGWQVSGETVAPWPGH